MLVPFGAFDDITIGYVEDIERFNPMHVPFPLEKMKSILCTVTNPNGI
ncbi:MAG: hypothetical protein RR994_02575 [Clostridia bacterium]